MGTSEDQGEDIFSLGEVSVTASSLTTIEAGESVHVITAEEIGRSSARTLDEALVLLPDIDVRVGIDGVPRVEIRGSKGKDILVLLDGVPINSAFDGQFDPSTIPVDSIAKIKVTVGASSVLYGQGALGGVISIITKKGQQGMKGSVGFEAGNGTPYLGKASLSGGNGKYDFFLSGSAYRRDAFPLAEPFTSSIYEEAGYRKNSDDTRNNVFLNLGFTPDDQWHFTLMGNYVEGGYGKPASAINNNFDPYAPRAQFGRVPNYDGDQFQFGADYTPSDAFDVKSRVYYNRVAQDDDQYDDQNYDTFNNPLIPNSFYLRNTGIKAGTSMQPTYDFGRIGALTFNFKGEQDTWMDTGGVKPGGGEFAQGGHGIGAGSPPYILYPVKDYHVFHEYSTGAEYKVSLLKNLTFAAGLADNWQIRSYTDLNGYSFSGSLRYDILKDTSLKAAFMRNINFPTMSELYLRPANNPTLLPEKAIDYQFGVEQKLPWASLFEVNGFYNTVHNFIGLQQEQLTPQEGFQPYNINFPLYRFYGFESSLETSFLKRLTLKLAYTLDETLDLSGPAFIDDRNQLQYVPKNKVTFTGKYDFDFGLTPFLSVVYVGDSVVYSKQEYVTVQRYLYMTPYIVANVKISQKILHDRVTVYVGADNIMNRNYEDTYGIPRPGRYVFAGFDYRF
jgi:outer membrane cobalamin receptor